MDTLAASLLSHQRGPTRKPALALSLLDSRFGAHRFKWQPLYQGAEADAPVAACITADGWLVRARNTGAEIFVSTASDPQDADLSAWTSLDATTIRAGAGVALAAFPGQVLIVYVTDSAGTRSIVARTSSDNGQTWSATTTVLSGATAIDFVALGSYNGLNSDTAVFYATAGDDEVWHRRRTSGTWAGSSTNWNRQGTVATITGLAAAHNGADFIIALTGTAETTGQPTLWAGRVGDFDLAADTYSALVAALSLDGASTSAFAGPAIFSTPTHPTIAFSWQETGDTAADQLFLTYPLDQLPTSPTYVMPFPAPATGTACALAWYSTDDGRVVLVTPSHVSQATLGRSADLSHTLIAADWSFSSAATRARFVLANAQDIGIDLEPEPGMDLELFAGYASGTAAAAQYGDARRFHVDRVERAFRRDGRIITTIHASGPWEAAARWATPIAIQFAAGSKTREQIAQAIAGRAGIPVDGAASGGWSTTSPAFLVPPGETAASALKRLLAPVPGITLHEAGRFTLDDVAGDVGDTSETYRPTLNPAAHHPILEAVSVDEPPPANWLRLQGPDRYADAFDHPSIAAHGPRFQVLRQNHATTDALAQDYAQSALERETLERQDLRLTVPYHAGHRLGDLVAVLLNDLNVDGFYTVTSIANTYTRSPSLARYDSTLTLHRRPELE